MADMDFPLGPVVGQKYTAPSGIVYEWDGYGWVIGFYDSTDQDLALLGDILEQIRTLLQDTDSTGSSGYRYSTDSIVAAINQGMLDMFRLRPDLFLENQYRVPKFSVSSLDAPLVVEEQYVPPLIYYTVGLVQLRDDEQNQDARGAAFMKTFLQSLVSVG